MRRKHILDKLECPWHHCDWILRRDALYIVFRHSRRKTMAVRLFCVVLPLLPSTGGSAKIKSKPIRIAGRTINKPNETNWAVVCKDCSFLNWRNNTMSNYMNQGKLGNENRSEAMLKYCGDKQGVDNCVQEPSSDSYSITTSNGCKATLIFSKEESPQIRREIAELLLRSLGKRSDKNEESTVPL